MLKLLLFASALLLHIDYAWCQTSYVTTIHPFQEILKGVVGQRAEVHCILPPGASPHTYQLRPSDLRKVEAATALIMGGPNLDAWAYKFQTPNRIELLDLVPDSLLLTLGEPEDQPKHDEAGGEHGHHHEGGIDPHFWTDPLTVKALLPALAHELSVVDPGGSEIYRRNASVFADRLDSLHSKIAAMLFAHRGQTVLLSHPFFQYFFKRYGLRLVGIIELAPGTEPTPKEMKRIIETIDRDKVVAILTHPQLSDRPAQLIAEAAGIRCVQLDPLGGTQGRDTYQEILLHNARVLSEALK